MKPSKFRDQNTVVSAEGAGQPQYQPLYALIFKTKNGEVISCWKMSFLDRLKVLITGRVWQSMMMFGKDVTPSYLSVNRKSIYSRTSDDKTFDKRLGRWFIKMLEGNGNMYMLAKY